MYSKICIASSIGNALKALMTNFWLDSLLLILMIAVAFILIYLKVFWFVLLKKIQHEKIKSYIEKGIAEGATLVTGGSDLPDNIERGFFIKPTIFANVKNNMTIAKEEIFGPVLSIIGYEDENDAIAIANDSDYGLSGYISSSDMAKAASMAKKIRTGMVHINYAPVNQKAPFGGYKKSGNGREWGEHGIEDFLEKKSIIGIKNYT